MSRSLHIFAAMSAKTADEIRREYSSLNDDERVEALERAILRHIWQEEQRLAYLRVVLDAWIGVSRLLEWHVDRLHPRAVLLAHAVERGVVWIAPDEHVIGDSALGTTIGQGDVGFNDAQAVVMAINDLACLVGAGMCGVMTCRVLGPSCDDAAFVR